MTVRSREVNLSLFIGPRLISRGGPLSLHRGQTRKRNEKIYQVVGTDPSSGRPRAQSTWYNNLDRARDHLDQTAYWEPEVEDLHIECIEYELEAKITEVEMK